MYYVSNLIFEQSIYSITLVASHHSKSTQHLCVHHIVSDTGLNWAVYINCRCLLHAFCHAQQYIGSKMYHNGVAFHLSLTVASFCTRWWGVIYPHIAGPFVECVPNCPYTSMVTRTLMAMCSHQGDVTARFARSFSHNLLTYMQQNIQ